jgi:hypothetical protein
MLKLIFIGFILTLISVFVVEYSIWLGLFIYIVGFVGSIAVLLFTLYPQTISEENKEDNN